MIRFVLFVLLHFGDSSNGQSISCNGEFECVDQTITSGDDNIFASGYKSISGIDTDIEVTDGGVIYIQGGFGCHEIGYVNTDGFIHNNAANGVMSAGSLVVRGIYNYCSVGATDTIITSDGSYVTCFADFTCKNSLIKASGNLKAQGFQSLHSAEIFSATNDPSIYFYGYYSGYNATITCESGDTCDIYCYGNGCYGLFLDCHDAATCNVYNCNETINIACPIDVVDGTAVTLPALLEDYQESDWLDMYNISIYHDDICNNVTIATRYDDADDTTSNMGVTDISIGSGNFLCCRAFVGCGGLDSIVISSGTDGGNIICSGIYSCQNIGIIDVSLSPLSGTYCTGRGSCRNTLINGSWTGTSRDHGHDTSVVVCGAFDACSNGKVYNMNRLYCAGCTSTDIINVGNIFVHTYRGADGATIYSNGNNASSSEASLPRVGINVTFAAYQSGYNVAVYCAVGDVCNVYCHTNGACDATTLIYGYCDNVNIYCNETVGITCPVVTLTNSGSLCNETGIT